MVLRNDGIERAMHASMVLAALLARRSRPACRSAGKQPDVLQPDPSWGSLGRSLWLDPKAKRVILKGRGCVSGKACWST